MSSELIIHTTQAGVEIALLEDKQLVEFHEEHYSDKFNVGDIYLGKVRKVVASLNAAFVDIGHKKDAFLHYLDLAPQHVELSKYIEGVRKGEAAPVQEVSSATLLNKEGKLNETLKRGDTLLVQITKVPISQKGLRVAGQLSLAGRFLILLPFEKGVSVSRRIQSSKERDRLLRLVGSICPENFGVIVRTAANGVSVSDLHKDMKGRLDTWDEGIKACGSAPMGERIIGEARRSLILLRDILGNHIGALHTDTPELYEEVLAYVREISPEKEKVVHLYEGKLPIFEQFGVAKQVRSVFGRYVKLPGGGSLVIDHTEALHVIDVNSGKNTKEEDQASNALRVNLNAVPEISRQIRLRDLGGIIVIDFIDMQTQEHKNQVQQAMKESMSKDRLKYTILPLTKFGLMQLTRHRVRPSVRIDKSEKCPSCAGSGKVANVLALGELLEQHVNYLFVRNKERALHIFLHPYLHAYFTKGLFSKRFQWKWRYKRSVKLTSDHEMSITDFRIENHLQKVIDLD